MSKITAEEAKNRILSTMPKRVRGIGGQTPQNIVEHIKTIDNNVFMFKKNSSYVLSPADDELNPIIGEFDEIPEDGSTPSCFEDWINTYSKEIEEFQLPEASGFQFVDLGLSVMWANMNLGAESPEDNGNYYAWGEIEPKTTYTWKTYKYYNGTATLINIGDNISKNDKYDAAYVINNLMYIPTKKQFQELIDKCTWTKINNGFEVKGPNGNSIFIPINGCISESNKVSYTDYIYCWTSDLNISNKNQAVTFKTINEDTPGFFNMMRRTGAAIRPVSEIKEDTNKRKTIDPLIPYKWSQTAPYNSLLPKDPSTGNRVLTGCSNTATAQIMAYWGCLTHDGKKYRRGCTKTESYTSSKGGIKINIPALDPIKIFDYDNLKSTTAEINKSADYKNAVATLMKYIGYASKANYTSNGTGTPVPESEVTFKNKLRLGSEVKLIYEKTNKDQFEEQIYQNLLKGWPVFICGWSSSGKSAHAFICDGYDSNTGKYHFNWGWGGSYNGWFELKSLLPSTYDFSYYKRAIINIHPKYVLGDTNNDGEVTTQDVLDVVKSVANNEYSENQDINSDEKVTLDDAIDLIDIIVSKKSSK